jgi:cytochrome c-type biogenesis protein CcmH/NrfG
LDLHVPKLKALAIFAIALALRLAAGRQLGELPLSRTHHLDALEYLTWAQRIVELGFYWPPFPEHAPGYPFFLAAFLAIFDGSLAEVRIFQCLLGAIGCVLTARIAARTLTPSAFVPAGLIQAAYGPLIYLDSAILAESLLMFLLIWSLDLATSADGRWSRWVACGAVLGAACVVRPTSLAIIPAYGVALLIKHGWRDQRSWRLIASLAIGALIFVGPVVAQNWRVSGVPMIQAYGGLNVYLGNRPSGDGGARARLGGEWDRLEGEASRASTRREEQDDYYMQRAIDEIAARPLAYLRLLGLKLLWTVQAVEMRDTHSYEFFRLSSPVLRWLPGFGFAMAFAGIGLLSARGRDLTLLIAYAAAVTVTLVFLVVGMRYRVPLVPVVIAFAGAGAATVIAIVRERRWRDLTAPVAAAVVAIVLTHARGDAASLNVSEEWVFTGVGLLRESNLDASETALRTAIDLDPQSSFAWDGLGLLLQRKDAIAASIDAFEKAVAFNPSNATAWVHLGFARERQRDLPGAITAYRAALAISPERTETITALGSALLVTGAIDEAEPLLVKADQRDDGLATLALASLAMQRRDATGALRHAERAVALAPSPRAWLLLAQASLVNGNFDRAEVAVNEAERAGLGATEVNRLRAILEQVRRR